jgi:ceramide glucosyltransferase
VALGVLPGVAWAMLAAVVVCRCATIRLTDRALKLPPTPLWLVPIRDVLSFGAFIASFFVRTVAWRGQHLRIGPDGQLILEGDSPA